MGDPVEADVDEEALLAAATRGDRQAFASLIHCYQAQLRAFVARHLFDQDDVQDVVQEALLEVWRSLPRFDRDKPFWPWLRAVARNRVLMYFRSRHRHRPEHLVQLDETICQIIEDHAEVRNEDVRVEALRGCLDGLEPDQRSLIHARFYDNEAVQDMAGRLQSTPAGITMRLQRLRLALKRCLERKLTEARP